MAPSLSDCQPARCDVVSVLLPEAPERLPKTPDDVSILPCLGLNRVPLPRRECECHQVACASNHPWVPFWIPQSSPLR